MSKLKQHLKLAQNKKFWTYTSLTLAGIGGINLLKPMAVSADNLSTTHLTNTNTNRASAKNTNLTNAFTNQLTQAIQNRDADTSTTSPTYNQTYHYNIPAGFLNDIQTIIKVGDHYNIYYLSNANYDGPGGNTSWGLVQTKDFKTFTDKGIALQDYTYGWQSSATGSLIFNQQPDGTIIDKRQPANAIFAYFASLGSDQEVHRAVSTDGGLTFHGYSGSASSTLSLSAPSGYYGFRDPKVVYNPNTKKLNMYIAAGHGNDNTEIRTYESTNGDGGTWNYIGDSTPMDNGNTENNPSAMECPNIVNNVIDQKTGEKKAIMFFGASQAGHSGTYYTVGTLNDNGLFVPDKRNNMHLIDGGNDNYGANFSGIPNGQLTNNGESINSGIIGISWLGSWWHDWGGSDVKHIGSMTLPRKITLNNGVLNTQVITPNTQLLNTATNTSQVTLPNDAGKVVMNFKNGTNNNTFEVKQSDSDTTFTLQNNQMTVHQNKALLNVSPDVTTSVPGNVHQVVLYVDRSSIEVTIPEYGLVYTVNKFTHDDSSTISATNQPDSIETYHIDNAVDDSTTATNPIDTSQVDTQMSLANAQMADINNQASLAQAGGFSSNISISMQSSMSSFYSQLSNTSVAISTNTIFNTDGLLTSGDSQTALSSAVNTFNQTYQQMSSYYTQNLNSAMTSYYQQADFYNDTLTSQMNVATNSLNGVTDSTAYSQLSQSLSNIGSYQTNLKTQRQSLYANTTKNLNQADLNVQAMSADVSNADIQLSSFAQLTSSAYANQFGNLTSSQQAQLNSAAQSAANNAYQKAINDNSATQSQALQSATQSASIAIAKQSAVASASASSIASSAAKQAQLDSASADSKASSVANQAKADQQSADSKQYQSMQNSLTNVYQTQISQLKAQVQANQTTKDQYQSQLDSLTSGFDSQLKSAQANLTSNNSSQLTSVTSQADSQMQSVQTSANITIASLTNALNSTTQSFASGQSDQLTSLKASFDSLTNTNSANQSAYDSSLMSAFQQTASVASLDQSKYDQAQSSMSQIIKTTQASATNSIQKIQSSANTVISSLANQRSSASSSASSSSVSSNSASTTSSSSSDSSSATTSSASSDTAITTTKATTTKSVKIANLKFNQQDIKAHVNQHLVSLKKTAKIHLANHKTVTLKHGTNRVLKLTKIQKVKHGYYKLNFTYHHQKAYTVLKANDFQTAYYTHADLANQPTSFKVLNRKTKQTFTVKKLIVTHGIPKFKLANGHTVNANKKVFQIK